MSTWASRYVRLRGGADRAGDMARLLGRIDADAQLLEEGTSSFAAWMVPSPTFQPDDLTALSKDFGEAIAIAVQTVADLVLYDHFVGGTRVRGLTYAGEAGWIRVAGEPEAWESATLFSKTRLAEVKEQLEEDFGGEELARQTADLERMWSVGKVVEGSPRPMVDPSGVARGIETHFGLPSRPSGFPMSGTMPHR